MLFKQRERAGVGESIAADVDGEVVAAVFAVAANLLRDPPHSGMVEEQSLHDGLQNADEVVVAADVRQFVSEDRFDLRRREAAEAAHRNEHYGA